MFRLVNSLLFTFILSLLLSKNGYANDYNLIDFLHPDPSEKNVYSCKFPCGSIEIIGKELKDNNALVITETMYMSPELLETDHNIPPTIKTEKIIYIEGNKLMKKIGRNKKNILIEGPVKDKLRWEIKGLEESLNGDDVSSGISKRNVTWECGIESLEQKKLFSELRNIITVKCESNFTPEEIILTRYASGIGLVEKITKNKLSNTIINDIKILRRE